MGLAQLEEIDAEAWFSGTKTPDSLKALSGAEKHFRDSHSSFEIAADRCALYQNWFPADRREEVTPDVTHFKAMVAQLSALIATLGRQELPSLGDIHSVSGALRNEMVVGERKSLAHRGTRHHFPSGHP